MAVLRGGTSSERAVSLRSGAEVERALRELGHATLGLDLDRELWPRLVEWRPDVAFIALHGRGGEDGTVQGMLELLGLPYTGSGVLASALCLDKVATKVVLSAAGIPTPPWEVVDVDDLGHLDLADRAVELEARLGLPLVVKPVREGSTIGLTVAGDSDAVLSGLRLAADFDRRLLVESFCAGTEVTVGVLGTRRPRALPIIEIVSERPLYDYDAKYTPGQSHHVIPARISADAATACAEFACRAHRELGCAGFSRVDFIVTGNGAPALLEVNTVPGLTSLSLFPDAARAAGLPFEELVSTLLADALERSPSASAAP
ncbi:MAG: D-alanine--D-alanine ligase family protein [Candidatus Dormibacteria bacterium]